MIITHQVENALLSLDWNGVEEREELEERRAKLTAQLDEAVALKVVMMMEVMMIMVMMVVVMMVERRAKLTARLDEAVALKVASLLYSSWSSSSLIIRPLKLLYHPTIKAKVTTAQ